MILVRRAFVVSAVASLVVACNGSSEEPDATAPVPTTTLASTTSTPTSEVAAESTTTDAPPTTAMATSTDAAPTTSVADQPDDSGLPDDLGPRLDSVPGVDSPGEIVEIADMVALFVPSALDPDDANLIPPLPEDLDIIVAYARAMTALYGQVTLDPVPVEPSAAMQATFLDGGEKYSQNVFAPRNAAGEHLEFFGDPDVLRPTVLADPRSDDEAFIFDCALSASRYVDADGDFVDGGSPGTQLAPLLVRLVRQDGGWIVDDIQDDERACR